MSRRGLISSDSSVESTRNLRSPISHVTSPREFVRCDVSATSGHVTVSSSLTSPASSQRRHNPRVASPYPGHSAPPSRRQPRRQNPSSTNPPATSNHINGTSDATPANNLQGGAQSCYPAASSAPAAHAVSSATSSPRHGLSASYQNLQSPTSTFYQHIQSPISASSSSLADVDSSHRRFSPSSMSTPRSQTTSVVSVGGCPSGEVDSQSQEYVDEKLAEFQAAIQHLQDEQERVQKKTFLNWINSYLVKCNPSVQLRSLISDLRDGTKLLLLLQILSGEKLCMERGRVLKRPHFISNIRTALQFLQTRNIKLVNINPSDIVDGRPAVVLGLVWTIILYFQIEENTRVLDRSGLSSDTSSCSNRSSHRPGARMALLNWARTAACGVPVSDFGPSWRDGKAFVAIVHCINPTVIDVPTTDLMSVTDRLNTAFQVAESSLGIARLLDPEDVDVPNPEEKSIMTYVAQFLHKYPEPHNAALSALDSVQYQVQVMKEWLGRTIHAIGNMSSRDTHNFSAFKLVKNETSSRYVKYEQMKSSQPTDRSCWEQMDSHWKTLQQLLSEWQSGLDECLPSCLLPLVRFLARAEVLLDCDSSDLTSGQSVTALMQQHQECFGELPMLETLLSEFSRSAAAGELPAEQLQHLHHRLRAVQQLADQRWSQLHQLHQQDLWSVYVDSYTRVVSWLDDIDLLVNELPRNPQQIERHLGVVSSCPEHLLSGVHENAQAVCASVCDSRRARVIDELTKLDTRWQASVEAAAVHGRTIQLVAQLLEADRLVSDAETALSAAEHQSRDCDESVPQLLAAASQLLADIRDACESTSCPDDRILTPASRLQQRLEKLHLRFISLSDRLRESTSQRRIFKTRLCAVQSWLDCADRCASADILDPVCTQQQINSVTDQRANLLADLNAQKESISWLLTSCEPSQLEQIHQLSDSFHQLASQLQLVAESAPVCLSYRVEVEEILRLMFAARDECSTAPAVWQNVQQLTGAVQTYRSCWERLQQLQLPELVCRGRQLSTRSRHTEQLVEQLETSWQSVQTAVSQQLQQATETEQLWRDVLDGVEQLETAVSDDQLVLTSSQLSAEPSKQLLQLSGCRSQQLSTENLEQLVLQLVPQVSPPAAEQLQVRLAGCTTQAKNVGDLILQRRETLTVAVQLYKQAEERVERLKQQLEAAKNSCNYPDEQLQQLNQDHQQLVDLIDQLRTSGFGVSRVSDDVDHLRESLDRLKAGVHQLREFERLVGELRQWLQQAEELVSAGIAAADDTEQLVADVGCWRNLKQLADGQEKLVKGVVAAGRDVPQLEAREEADSLACRWTKVRSSAAETLQKLETRLCRVQQLQHDVKIMEQWLNSCRDITDGLSGGTEDRLSEVERVLSECCDQQVAAGELIRRCDDVVGALSPVGTDQLRARAVQLNTTLSDRVHQLQLLQTSAGRLQTALKAARSAVVNATGVCERPVNLDNLRENTAAGVDAKEHLAAALLQLQGVQAGCACVLSSDASATVSDCIALGDRLETKLEHWRLAATLCDWCRTAGDWAVDAKAELQNSTACNSSVAERTSRLHLLRNELSQRRQQAAEMAEQNQQLLQLLPVKSGIQRLLNTTDEQLQQLDSQLVAACELADELAKLDLSVGDSLVSCADQLTTARQCVANKDEISTEQRLRSLLEADRQLQGTDPQLHDIGNRVKKLREAGVNVSEHEKDCNSLVSRCKSCRVQLQRLSEQLKSTLLAQLQTDLTTAEKLVNLIQQRLDSCPSDATVLKSISEGLLQLGNACEKLTASCQQLLDLLPVEQLAEVSAVTHQLIEKRQLLANQRDGLTDKNQQLQDALCKFEQIRSSLDSSLTELEQQVGSLSSPALLEQLPARMKSASALSRSVQQLVPSLTGLSELQRHISDLTPDPATHSCCQLLCARHEAVVTSSIQLLDKLASLNEAVDVYQRALQSTRDWVAATEEQVSCLTDPEQDTDWRQDGQLHLTNLISTTEQLVTGLAGESREAVRGEVRALRSEVQDVCDKACVAMRQLQEQMRIRADLQRSLQQLRSWIPAAEEHLQSCIDSRPETLAQYQVRLSDVAAVVQQMEDRRAVVSELQNSPVSCVDEVARFSALQQTADGLLARCQEDVSVQKARESSIQTLRNWLNSQRQQLVAAQHDLDEVARQTTFSCLDSSLQSGQQRVAVLVAAGEESPDPRVTELQSDLNALTADLTAAQKQLHSAQQKRDKEVQQLQKLHQRLQQLRDEQLPLVDTAEQKREQVEEVKNRVQRLQQIRSELQELPAAGDLQQCYQHTNKLLTEQVLQLQQGAAEHEQFDREAETLSGWLDTAGAHLQKEGSLTGNESELEARRAALEELTDEWTRRALALRETAALSEKLSPHTGTAGREWIREYCRQLQSRAQVFSELLHAASAEHENCRQQWCDLTAANKQLDGWLQQMEAAIGDEQSPFPTTVHEKQLQLQSHSNLHGQIEAHEDQMTDVCSRTQRLVQLTRDDTLNDSTNLLQSRYNQLQCWSQKLLEQLQLSVENHENLQTACSALRDLINAERQNITSLENASGDQQHVKTRLEQLQQLLERLKSHSQQQLAELHTQLSHAAATSSVQGAQLLTAEVQLLEDQLQQLVAQADHVKKLLTDSLERWAQFQLHYGELLDFSKLQKGRIAAAKQLRDSLPEKQETLDGLEQVHRTLSARESDIDQLIELANSPTDKPAAQARKLAADYQELMSACHSACSCWQQQVEEHREYDEKYSEADRWLSAADVSSAEKIPAGQTLVHSVSSIGERLLVNTAAGGRQSVRQQLTDIKKRWENLQERVRTFRQQEIVKREAEVNAGGIIQHLSCWLQEAEAVVAAGPDSWNSVVHVKARSFRLKELMTDSKLPFDKLKAAQSSADKLPEDVCNQLLQLSKRMDSVLESAGRNITVQESLCNHLKAHQQLLRDHKDWAAACRIKLDSISAPMSEHSDLAQSLKQCSELEQQLKSGPESWTAVTSQVPQLRQLLPDVASAELDEMIAREAVEVKQLLEDALKAQSDISKRFSQFTECEAALKTETGRFDEAELLISSLSLLKNSLDEKQQQLKGLQELSRDLTDQHHRLLELSSTVHDLLTTSSDSGLLHSLKHALKQSADIRAVCQDLLPDLERFVKQHEQYVKVYDSCVADESSQRQRLGELQLLAVLPTAITAGLELVRELRSASLSPRLAAVQQLADDLYTSTAADGCQLIREQLQQLQDSFDELQQQLSDAEVQLCAAEKSQFDYDRLKNKLKTSLEEMSQLLSTPLELRATLDEKSDKLLTLKTRRSEVASLAEVLAECREKAAALRDPDEEYLQQSPDLLEQLVARTQSDVERYEEVVGDHQRYSDAVMAVQEYQESTQCTLDLWSSPRGELEGLKASLHKLQLLKADIEEEEVRVELVQTVGEKVLPNTSADGQENVRAQLETTRQEWEALKAGVGTALTSVQRMLDQWNRFLQMKSDWTSWLDRSESVMRDVALRCSLQEKQQQLQQLAAVQDEVDGHQLEIDTLTDGSQELTSRQSEMSDIIQRYQRLAGRVTAAVQTWMRYVAVHTEYIQQYQQADEWLQSCAARLSDCCDPTFSTQHELAEKITAVKRLMIDKEEGLKLVRSTSDLGQTVMTDTAPAGHEVINGQVSEITRRWEELVAKVAGAKVKLNELQLRWAGFLEEVQKLEKMLSDLSSQLKDAEVLQTSMSSKRLQIDRLKALKERVNSEQSDLEALELKTAELCSSSGDTPLTTHALQLLGRYQHEVQRVDQLLHDREQQYSDHRSWRQALDDFHYWMSSVGDKRPSTRQRSLADRVSLETSIAALDGVLQERPSGDQKLQLVLQAGDQLLAGSSEEARREVEQEMAAAKLQLQEFFNDVERQRNGLQTMEMQMRQFKEQHERLSDWLQTADAQLKQLKSTEVATELQTRQLADSVQQLCDSLEEGSCSIDLLEQSAGDLLSSHHVETYIVQQLRSRYQVQVNLCRDQLQRLTAVGQLYEQLAAAISSADSWIREARDKIRICSDVEPHDSKTLLQQHLSTIQELVRDRDTGETLVQRAASLWERLQRPGSRGSGSDDEAARSAVKRLHADWDALCADLGRARSCVESHLQRCRDARDIYNQLRQAVGERQRRLQQLMAASRRPADLRCSVTEKKDSVNKYNAMLQDLSSMEPRVSASVATCGIHGGRELGSEFEQLCREVHQLHDRQLQLLGQQEAFLEAAGVFQQWLHAAREARRRCERPADDVSRLHSRIISLTSLETGLEEGEAALHTALQLAQSACLSAEDPDDREVVEEHVAKLQCMMDDYKDSLAAARQLLDSAAMTWTGYESQLRECQCWIADKQQQITSLDHLQRDLPQKQAAFESLQSVLAEVFDHQSAVEALRRCAGVLLESCSDSRVSSSVTQLCADYSALQSNVRDACRRLEVAHMDHMQHWSLCQEAAEWVRRTTEQLAETEPAAAAKSSDSRSELLDKLVAVQQLQSSLEQGEQKLRSVMDMKACVLSTTTEDGAVIINNECDSLHQSFKQLSSNISDRRNRLQELISASDSRLKAMQRLAEILDDIEINAGHLTGKLNSPELAAKKSALARYSSLLTELDSSAGDIASKLRSPTSPVNLPMDTGDSPATDSSPGDLPEDVVTRHDRIRAGLQSAVVQLQRCVAAQQRYLAAAEAAREWLRKAWEGMQSAGSLQEPAEKLEQKREAVRAVLESLAQGKELVQSVRVESVALKQDSGVVAVGDVVGADDAMDAGEDVFESDVKAIQDEFDRLCDDSRASEESLTDILKRWSDAGEKRQKLEAWLDANDRQIQSISADEEADVAEVKSLHTAISEGLSDVNGVCELWDLLSDSTWQLEAGSSTAGLRDRHTAQLQLLEEVIARLEKQLVVCKVDAARQKFLVWLEAGRSCLEECQPVDCSAEQLERNCQRLVQLSEGLVEGKRLLDDAVVFNHDTADEGDLQFQYGQFSANVQRALHMVEEQQQLLQKAQEQLSDLERWLSEVELDVSKPIVSGGASVTAIQGQLNAWTELERRLQARRPELKSLQQRHLFELRVTALVDRWQQCIYQCDGVVTALRTRLTEQEEYNRLLNEAQKWLLETSHQLFVSSSQLIADRPQTQQALERHKQVQVQIDGFRERLAELELAAERRHELATPTTDGLTNQCADEMDADRQQTNRQLANIRDSYDSVNSTAHRIEKRLRESLDKFQQHESILSDVDSRLNRARDTLAASSENYSCLKAVTARLNALEMVQEQLVADKLQVEAAVQLCESARAAVSRPASPLDREITQLPQLELQVRCRLEQLVDQCQTQLSGLRCLEADVKQLETRAGQLVDWAEERKTHLEQLGSAPVRPRAVQRVQEIQMDVAQQLQEILLVEKEFQKLLTAAPQLRARQLLQQLQTQANDTLKFLGSSQKRVKDHQSSMDSLSSWINRTADELKRVDVESRDIESWSSSVSDLLQSCEQHKPLLQRLQESAGSVQRLLGNPEEQQVEEVIRRFRQLHQLLAQRLQHLQSAGDQLTAVTSQIRELDESSQGALQRLTTEVAPLGYLPEPASEQLQNALAIQMSISSKQQLLPQVVKSVESLREQLPKQQHLDLVSSLQKLQKRMKTLEEVVKERTASLQSSLTRRQEFQQAHTAVEQRLKAADVPDAPLQLPLTVDEMHGMVRHADRVVTDLDAVLERDLADLEKLAASVRPGCSTDHLQQMDRIVSSLRDAASLRRDEMTRRRDHFRELEESRSRFLQELDSCRTWLDSTQTSLKQIPLSVTTLTLMQQHALRMNELRREFNDRNQLLTGVLKQSQQLLPQLRAQDCQSVSEQLTTIEAQYGKMGARIERRCEAFRSAVSQQERISQKVTSSISYLAEIRTEISSLNRPLGADIEDAQALLASYEDVLKKLRDFKKQLDVLRTQTMEGMTELNELVRQQDQLMSVIEAHLQRLRQLVITRQQYMQLTVEINSLLATSSDEASCLEQEQLPAARKLECFDELLRRIGHVETLLEETRRLEGRMELQGDGVSHQLSSLQQRTSTLKQSVVDRQTHWRRTAQQTTQLLDQISQLVDKLKQRQQLLQLRPQLHSTSPADLQLLLQQVRAFSVEVEVELDALRQRLSEAGRLEVSAGELSDSVRQAAGLIDSVSTELAAYVQHHTDAEAVVDRHRQLHAAVSDWLRQLQAAGEAAADSSADCAGRLQRAESVLSERQSRAQQLNELSQSVRQVTAILATSVGQKVNQQHCQLTNAVTAALGRLQQLSDAAARQLTSCRRAHQLIQQLQLVLQPVTAAVDRQAGSRDQLSQLLEDLTKHQGNLQTNDALVTELHGLASSLQDEQLVESVAAVQLIDSWQLVSQKLQQRIDDVTRSHQLCTRLEADLVSMETLVDDVTLRLHDRSGATSLSDMESQILTLQTDSGRLSEALTRADQLRQESGTLMHMWNASDSTCLAAALSQRCQKLLVRLPELQGSVTSQLTRISGDRDAVRQYISRASSLRHSLQTQISHLTALDGRSDDQESRAIDSLLQNLMSDSDRLTDDVSSLRDEVNQRYSIISDIQDEMNAVESLLAHLQDLSLQRSQSLKNCVSQMDQYQQDVKSLRAEISQLDVQLRAVSQPQYISQQPQTALIQQQEYQQRLRDLRTAVSVRVRRVREMLQRARPDPSPLPPVLR